MSITEQSNLKTENLKKKKSTTGHYVHLVKEKKVDNII